MANDFSAICSELKTTADDAKATFGSLSAEQLNWKPSPKSWSIAQCFDHLITTHSLYFPLFERLASGNTKQTFWESYSPLSGFFGRYLIQSLRPENVKPIKTTSKAQPSSSEIGGDIIERYREHQSQMIDAIRRIPANLDLSKRRAAAVRFTLNKEFGIDENRMEADGKGESDPIDRNDTPAGKANNRRVEFIKL